MMRIWKWFNVVGLIGVFFFALFIVDVMVLVDNSSCVSVPDVFIPNIVSLFFPIIFLSSSFIWMGASIESDIKRRKG